MAEVVKKPKKQDSTPPSKKHMVTLWVAVATALGSTGVPKIVDMLDTKPSVEQVQTIVAKQLAALSKEQPVAVAAIHELDARLDDIEQRLAETCGQVDVVRDVLADCCTRRQALRKLVRAHKGGAKPEMAPPPEPNGVMLAPPAKLFKKDSSVGRLKEVPQFNVQQQLQLQFQEEPEK